MGFKGYQTWHGEDKGKEGGTIVVLHQNEYKLVKDDGTYRYPEATRVAEYQNKKWKAPVKFIDGEWRQQELSKEVKAFIGDYIPDESLLEEIREKISHNGAIALQRIQKQYY